MNGCTYKASEAFLDLHVSCRNYAHVCALHVFVVQLAPVCVCLCHFNMGWAVWTRIKVEKGKSSSLTGGLAAIAALAPLQSQGVVTSQGQRFSGVPSKRVNDGPSSSLERGHAADLLQLFYLTAGWKVRLLAKFKTMNSAVCEHVVWKKSLCCKVTRGGEYQAACSERVRIFSSRPLLFQILRQARRTHLISLLVQSSKPPEVFGSDFSLQGGDKEGRRITVRENKHSIIVPLWKVSPTRCKWHADSERLALVLTSHCVELCNVCFMWVWVGGSLYVPFAWLAPLC